MKSIFRIGIVTTFLIFMFIFDSSAQMPIKVDDHFPRIEVYREKDHGDPKAGNNKHIGADGKVYYMGRSDYAPYIERTSYLLPSSQMENLLNSKLNFLPYFNETKSDIMLGHYFKMDKLQDLPQRTGLFPRSINGYLEITKNKEIFPETIIGYRNISPLSIEIVWLDKETWFVNNTFYFLETDPLIKTASSKHVDTKLVAGTIRNFIEHSYLIQPKVDERIRSLNLDPTKSMFKADDQLVEIGLTPGGPGSSSFSYRIFADGRVVLPGLNYYTPSYRLKHYQLVDIQNELSKIDLAALSRDLKPAPFVHNGQSYILAAKQKGAYHRFVYSTSGNPTPQSVTGFTNYLKQLIAGLEK